MMFKNKEIKQEKVSGGFEQRFVVCVRVCVFAWFTCGNSVSSSQTEPCAQRACMQFHNRESKA